jgi:hypothetical protein
MDTLPDRLAELAGDAPTGGATAAELWAHGRRMHRRRSAALAVAVLVVGAAGTGLGLRVTDGAADRSDPGPAEIDGFESSGITLPIEYPAGEVVPELEHAPGRLAAAWVEARASGIRLVGLVAETGEFGTLPIDNGLVYHFEEPNGGAALSPDGRMIAYTDGTHQLVVRDLQSGEQDAWDWLGTRQAFTWFDSRTLVGHGPAGRQRLDGWVWEPSTSFRRVNRAE